VADESREAGAPFSAVDYFRIPSSHEAPVGPVRGSELESQVILSLREIAEGVAKVIHFNTGSDVRVIKLVVPAGIQEGQAVLVKGEGAASPNGGPPGDLHVYVKVAPNALFKRDGNDLRCQIPVGADEAGKGCKIVVPTLDGGEEIVVPPRTPSGTMIRLAGAGIPDLRTGKAGDQIVELVVESKDDARQRRKQLLKDFAGLDGSKKAGGVLNRLFGRM